MGRTSTTPSKPPAEESWPRILGADKDLHKTLTHQLRMHHPSQSHREYRSKSIICALCGKQKGPALLKASELDGQLINLQVSRCWTYAQEMASKCHSALHKADCISEHMLQLKSVEAQMSAAREALEQRQLLSQRHLLEALSESTSMLSRTLEFSSNLAEVREHDLTEQLRKREQRCSRGMPWISSRPSHPRQLWRQS